MFFVINLDSKTPVAKFDACDQASAAVVNATFRYDIISRSMKLDKKVWNNELMVAVLVAAWPDEMKTEGSRIDPSAVDEGALFDALDAWTPVVLEKPKATAKVAAPVDPNKPKRAFMKGASAKIREAFNKSPFALDDPEYKQKAAAMVAALVADGVNKSTATGHVRHHAKQLVKGAGAKTGGGDGQD